MTPCFENLRERAFELAETARYNHWEEIGAAMEAEGMDLAITRLESDPALRRALNARCELARRRGNA